MKNLIMVGCGMLACAASLFCPQEETKPQQDPAADLAGQATDEPVKSAGMELKLEAEFIQLAPRPNRKRCWSALTLALLSQAAADDEQVWLDLLVTGAQTATVLGVHVRRPDETLRSQLQIDEGMGLVIEQIVADSAAADAGLQTHDVIVSFDGQLLVNEEQLTTLVRNTDPGETVSLSLFRSGRQAVFDVVLKEGTISQGEAVDSEWSGWLLEAHPQLDPFVYSAHSNVNCSACHTGSGSAR